MNGIKPPGGFGEKLIQFIKYCMVGGSGVVVDMGVLYLLTDPQLLGWPIALGKAGAGEAALLSNFCLNEIWTFRAAAKRDSTFPSVLRRLWKFHAICGVGIFIAIILLQLLHALLGMNLYLANGVAIVLVTVWNFVLNRTLNWTTSREQ